MLVEHLGDADESIECNEMCDNCKRDKDTNNTNKEIVIKNITEECKIILKEYNNLQ